MTWAVVALCTALALSLATTEQAAASLDDNAQYEGSSSINSQVHIIISADHRTADVTFDYPFDRLAPLRPECPAHAEFLAVPIQDKTMRVENRAAGPEVISFVGYFDSPLFTAATGSFLVTPAPGKPCLPRQGTWRAGVIGLQLKGAPAGVFTGGIAGDVYRLGGSGTPIGTAQLTTNEFGNGLTSLLVQAAVGACSYQATLQAKQLIYDVGATFEASDTSAQAWAGSGAADPYSISMGMILGPNDACPAVVAYFTADRPPSQATAVPTATATPGPSSSPTVTPASQGGAPRFLGGKFPASGFGLGVFSGGSNADLVTASGCPASTSSTSSPTPQASSSRTFRPPLSPW